MSTVLDFLTDALLYINAIAPGDVISTDDSSLALRMANRLLDSWSAEKIALPGLKNPQITLSGAASYPIGPAAAQAISSATLANPAVLTVPTTAGFTTGSTAVLSGITQTGWNGAYAITALTSTTITIKLDSSALVAISGGTPLVNQQRLMKIKSASTIAANGSEMEARVVTAEAWQAIPDKTRTGLFVESLFYDMGFPTGNLNVSPKPAAGTLSLWIYEQIVQLVNLTDTLTLAPGYELPLLVSLAKYLAVPFGRPIGPDLIGLANEAKATIKQLNAEIIGIDAQTARLAEAAQQLSNPSQT